MKKVDHYIAVMMKRSMTKQYGNQTFPHGMLNASNSYSSVLGTDIDPYWFSTTHIVGSIQGNQGRILLQRDPCQKNQCKTQTCLTCICALYIVRLIESCTGVIRHGSRSNKICPFGWLTTLNLCL